MHTAEPQPLCLPRHTRAHAHIHTPTTPSLKHTQVSKLDPPRPLPEAPSVDVTPPASAFTSTANFSNYLLPSYQLTPNQLSTASSRGGPLAMSAASPPGPAGANGNSSMPIQLLTTANHHNRHPYNRGLGTVTGVPAAAPAALTRSDSNGGGGGGGSGGGGGGSCGGAGRTDGGSAAGMMMEYPSAAIPSNTLLSPTPPPGSLQPSFGAGGSGNRGETNLLTGPVAATGLGPGLGLGTGPVEVSPLPLSPRATGAGGPPATGYKLSAAALLQLQQQQLRRRRLQQQQELLAKHLQDAQQQRRQAQAQEGPGGGGAGGSLAGPQLAGAAASPEGSIAILPTELPTHAHLRDTGDVSEGTAGGGGGSAASGAADIGRDGGGGGDLNSSHGLPPMAMASAALRGPSTAPNDPMHQSYGKDLHGTSMSSLLAAEAAAAAPSSSYEHLYGASVDGVGGCGGGGCGADSGGGGGGGGCSGGGGQHQPSASVAGAVRHGLANEKYG